MCHECSGFYVNSVVSDFDVCYPPKFAECEKRNMRVGLTLRAAEPCCPLAFLLVEWLTFFFSWISSLEWCAESCITFFVGIWSPCFCCFCCCWCCCCCFWCLKKTGLWFPQVLSILVADCFKCNAVTGAKRSTSAVFFFEPKIKEFLSSWLKCIGNLETVRLTSV